MRLDRAVPTDQRLAIGPGEWRARLGPFGELGQLCGARLGLGVWELGGDALGLRGRSVAGEPVMESREEEQTVELDVEQGRTSLAQPTCGSARAARTPNRRWRLMVVAVGCARLLGCARSTPNLPA